MIDYVEIKSAGFSKRDRVVVNIGTEKKPEWYLATVTSYRNKKVNVLLDNGVKDTVPDDKRFIRRSDYTRKREERIPERQLSKYVKKKNVLTFKKAKESDKRETKLKYLHKLWRNFSELLAT